jgi:staphylococcal nuclease domain-containing protein 1
MLEGVDKHGNLFGTLIHPAGIISIELVKQGYARTMDWSLKLAKYQPQLQAAEREAKGSRLRLWKDYVAPVSSLASISSSSREWTAKIVEIISGDLFVVRDASVSPPIDRRVSLSSVRAPRIGGKDKADEAWAWQSREFFREKFIGRVARLCVDYTREVVPGDASTSRMFVTALVEGKNVAEVMAHEGLVTAQKHRTDDERSPAYDVILTAEKAALAAKKSIHSSLPPPSRRPVSDVSSDVARAKQFLPFLTRDSDRIKAVVEHVVNGARFKLLIPKEYCVVSFVLSGVRCPQPPRGAESPGEEFGIDALNFTRDTCLQHDVEIRVETQDRGGSFIGSMYVNGKNLSTMLLREGLAYLGPTFYPERVADAEQLKQAQETAKAAKVIAVCLCLAGWMMTCVCS